jgi:hypothetical protein
MRYRFNYIEYKKNNEEYRLEYDLSKIRLFYKENDGAFIFDQCTSEKGLKEVVETIKKDWESKGYKKSGEGFHGDDETFLMQKIFDKVEKDGKSDNKKEDNPYKSKNKEALRNEYFNIANNELPKMLSAGFIKAVQKYKKSGNDEGQICCILDIAHDKPRMIFTFGDGGDCESASNENVFLVYPTDTALSKCKSMVEAVDTLNLKQESSHWLSDAAAIAAEQGALKDISVTMYGNIQFGDLELDVIYEN